tara:strand:+ start:233 stop:1564 length:1332 start_codon:yes stop_codon:yes gene_type:complete
MIIMRDNIHNQKNSVGIIGLGTSGRSAIKYFKNFDYNIYVFDNNRVNNNIADVKFLEPSLWPWEKIKELIVSPGIPVSQNSHPSIILAKSYNVPIIPEIDLLARKKPKAKIIGITGTNGKSTSTAMIAHVLKEFGLKCNIGGNFGIPASSIYDPGKDGYIIIEFSSFQLEICKEIKLDGAIILNITPDHIDRHGDFLSYIKAKLNISNCLKKNAPLLINYDDINIKKNLEGFIKNRGKLIYFSNKNKYEINFNSKAKINNENISSLLLLLENFGFNKNDVLRKINSFNGLPHRLELVTIIKNNKFINDSKATNAEATKSALKQFTNIYWIAGGRSKTDGINKIKDELKNVKKCYLIGESRFEFKKQIADEIPSNTFKKLNDAIDELYHDLKKENNATILFSPAAASFDQYNNFEMRGNDFKNLIFLKFNIKEKRSSDFLGENS